jgi:hypothetical protein
MRPLLFALWASLAVTSSAHASNSARQSAFARAMTLLESGEPARAVEILSPLFEESREPRVRLELARALLASGDLKRARALFVAAYDAEPPPPVKARILQFIEQIDRSAGKFLFGVSLTKAQNPLRLPSQFGVNFNGIALSLEDAPKRRNLYGAVYTSSYEKQFASGADIRIQGSLRDLENSFGDFRFLDASVGLSTAPNPFEFRIGLQALDMKAQTYRMPYVEGAYRLALADNIAFAPRIQVGSYQPKEQDGLAGESYKLSAPLEISLNAHRKISLGVKVERRTAKFAEQAYVSLGPYLDAAIQFEYVTATASLSARTSVYSGVDPFWDVRRRDRSLYASMGLETDKLRYAGMIPSAGVYCDINRSNIAYYRATDCGVLTNLRKLY